jgi:integrase
MAIRKLPSGRYQISFFDTERHKRREAFDTLREAKATLDERRGAVRKREYVAPAGIPTVKEAAVAWLEGKKISESKHGGPVKESTLEFWQNHIDRFIVPTLGNYRVDVVPTALVEKKREEWKTQGKLSGKTVNKILTTLDAIFQKQLALRTIGYNPVAVAERMARGSNEVGEGGELDIDGLEVRPEEVYNPMQLHRLINVATAGFNRAALEFYACTGARHGEGLGLAWRDVDFERSEIVIRRNWSGIYRNGEPIFTTAKSKHSFRKIPIPAELVLTLKKWKLQCPSSAWDLVFPKGDGRPQDRKAMWRALDAAIRAANNGVVESEKLPRHTIHGLRHSFASIHLANGTPITEVSALLGHANVNITMTVYAHFIPKMQTDSAARLAASIFQAHKEVATE